MTVRQIPRGHRDRVKYRARVASTTRDRMVRTEMRKSAKRKAHWSPEYLAYVLRMADKAK